MSVSIQAKISEPSWFDLLKQQVGSVRYGIIQIVVHDGRVVQIERTEKIRFDQSQRQEQSH